MTQNNCHNMNDPYMIYILVSNCFRVFTLNSNAIHPNIEESSDVVSATDCSTSKSFKARVASSHFADLQ